MNISVRRPVAAAATDATLREAMRHMAGGVSVVTAGIGDERTGLTVTTATSLSLEPPTMLILVSRTASAYPVITVRGHFAVNIVSAEQEHVASRFAGRGGIKGAARYDGADWFPLATGASGLVGALAVIDCAVEEVIERHSHGMIIGAVRGVYLTGVSDQDALIYAQGRFGAATLNGAPQ